MREFPQVAIKGKVSHSSSPICSECPQYTLTASRAAEAGAHTLRRTETFHFQASLTSQQLGPHLLATVWANRMLISLTPEQQHCTIQFILYISSA